MNMDVIDFFVDESLRERQRLNELSEIHEHAAMAHATHLKRHP